MPARLRSIVLALAALCAIGVSGAGARPVLAAENKDDAEIEGLLPAVVNAITVRNRTGVAVTKLTPRDTFYVDVSISDADGFQDVIGVQLDLAFGAFKDPPLIPAFGGRYSWRRAGRPNWLREEPVGSTWEIVPSR